MVAEGRIDTLVLVRHALAVSNVEGLTSCTPPGAGLAPQGVNEGRRLGAALAGEPADLGVATELVRTQETLELGLAGRSVPVLVVPELNEIDFGAYDGGPLEEYRDWAATHAPDLRAPGGGESRADVAARFARGLRVLLARPERTIVSVGHALQVRYTLDAARGLVPAPLMTPVENAVPYPLTASEVDAAATLLERWSLEPRFREPTV